MYDDVAKQPCYQARGLEYADLANTNMLMQDPELFWKFWGDCREVYHSTSPHSGYAILNKWCSILPKMVSSDGHCRCCVYTSNVDGHFRRYAKLNENLCEMHGCVEESVCSSSLCYYVTRVSDGTHIDQTISTHQRLMNDKLSEWNTRGNMDQRASCGQVLCATPLRMGSADKYSFDSSLTQGTIPMCAKCKLYPLRPLVVMFGDACPNVIPRVWQKTDAYQRWENSLEADILQAQARGGDKNVVVLELGCGTRVPSVRKETEDVVYDICLSSDKSISTAASQRTCAASLIRINIEDESIPDEILTVSPDSFGIRASCKDVLEKIDEHISLKLALLLSL